MIGNDVIDLAAARTESNWRRAGFLQKIFTGYEQQIIQQSPEPEVMVWVLWSMKEAAYKIYNRETRIRAFIPHLLQCHFKSESMDGTVILSNKSYYTYTVVHNDMVHTVAVTDKSSLNAITAVQYETIYKDEDGLPYILLTSANVAVPVSVSGHGRFRKVVRFRQHY